MRVSSHTHPYEAGTLRRKYVLSTASPRDYRVKSLSRRFRFATEGELIFQRARRALLQSCFPTPVRLGSGGFSPRRWMYLSWRDVYIDFGLARRASSALGVFAITVESRHGP